jgi:hypothetical protein
MLALVTTSAQAQVSGTKYYIDWDDAANKCVVVENKSTTDRVTGGGRYESRAQAEAAFKTVKGCSPESMKPSEYGITRSSTLAAAKARKKGDTMVEDISLRSF